MLNGLQALDQWQPFMNFPTGALLALMGNCFCLVILEEMAHIFDKDSAAVPHEGAIIEALAHDPGMKRRMNATTHIEDFAKEEGFTA
jgi:hypothetical protein